MNNTELVKYRTELFRNAAAFRKVDRIPHMSFAVTWKILDAGYSLTEGLRDYDIMTSAIRTHQERYNFDAIFELGVRNIIRLVDHLGGGTYIINDEIGAIEYKDNALVELDELDDYMKDPTKFLWERGMAKKYPKWADGTISVADIQKCFDEQKAFLSYYNKIRKTLTKEYGMPTFTAQSVPCYPGIDFLFNSILGIKNLSVLMRRDPEKVDQAVAVTNGFFQEPGIAALKKRRGPNPKACYDYDIAVFFKRFCIPREFYALSGTVPASFKIGQRFHYSAPPSFSICSHSIRFSSENGAEICNTSIRSKFGTSNTVAWNLSLRVRQKA